MTFSYNLKTLTETVSEPIHRALHDAQSPLAAAKMHAQHLAHLAGQASADSNQQNTLRTSAVAISQAIQQSQDGLRLLGLLFQTPQARATEDSFSFQEICTHAHKSYPYKNQQDAQKIQYIFAPEYTTLIVLGHKTYTANALQLMLKNSMRAPVAQTWHWSFGDNTVHLQGVHFTLENDKIEPQLEWQYVKNVFAVNNWEWVSLQQDRCSFKVRTA